MKDVQIHPKEELLNTISHAVGAIFGIIGLYLLLSKNIEKTPYTTISIIVYSVTFISMFIASSMYHYVRDPELKKKLRVVDHINIYFLIAGTYTPMCLITLIDAKGWIIFYIVWVIVAVGTLLKLFLTGKFEILSLVLYLAMGWLVVYDFDNLSDYTSSQGIQLLFLGGAFYTLGIIFYAIDRIPYNHFIWHLFVLGGAISHWLMIYLYVI
ncbi:hemolysin III family protein [Maribacter algarum]|uniref:Hemolysin III family protein n=1 Tax=Maribacter algarum (ex Zhang et al. 2020) TaxID=2578118 RepID=A0A5S3PIB1_9FLAO|nr:hemolysin III family protein [Maribacter algarum]TMM53942.1 hemolysin III family protein [Maribacter algarum]